MRKRKFFSQSPGALRQAKGALAEREVASALESARLQRIAYLWRSPTPVRILSLAEGRVSGVLSAPQGVDFVGVLAGGRAVFLEVKACSAASLSLDCLSRAQVEQLEAALSFGAAAALLVRWEPPSERWRAQLPRLPAWSLISWREARELLPARALPPDLLLARASDRWYEKLAGC